MTLPDAHATARNGAARFGNVWRVFRLPAWPGGVYTATTKDPPVNADVIATYPESSPAEVPAPRGESQGSLF